MLKLSINGLLSILHFRRFTSYQIWLDSLRCMPFQGWSLSYFPSEISLPAVDSLCGLSSLYFCLACILAAGCRVSEETSDAKDKNMFLKNVSKFASSAVRQCKYTADI